MDLTNNNNNNVNNNNNNNNNNNINNINNNNNNNINNINNNKFYYSVKSFSKATQSSLIGDTVHNTGINLLLSTSVWVLLSLPIERRETRAKA